MTEQIHENGDDTELRRALQSKPWSPEPSLDTTKTLAEATNEPKTPNGDNYSFGYNEPLRGADVGSEVVSGLVVRGDDAELRALPQGLETRGDDEQLRAQPVAPVQQPPQPPTPEA